MAAAAAAVVAVTGANGFIASHIIDVLLSEGYTVRAIVRNKDDPSKTAHLAALAEKKENGEGRLEFFSGDLLTPGSYDEAFAGASYVIHTAAVVLLEHKDPQRGIVQPSVEGTQNVLASAAKAKATLKRFVHTSSVAAVMDFGVPADKTVFDETSFNTWASVERGDAYGTAKLQAERLVTDHCAQEDAGFDCAIINPCIVLGQCLTKAHTKASPVVVRQALYGNEQPSYYGQFVDVRDVALAHVRAMTAPEAGGERFIVAAPHATHSMWIKDIGRALQPLFDDLVVESPPIAWWKLLIARMTFQLSEYQKIGLERVNKFDGSKAERVLGVAYRPLEDTLRDTVASMVDTGFVKPRRRSTL